MDTSYPGTNVEHYFCSLIGFSDILNVKWTIYKRNERYTDVLMETDILDVLNHSKKNPILP